MATTYYPDFSKLSQYDHNSGVIAVRYGADAPITEMELNEAQLIQNQKRKELTGYLFSNGLSDKSGSIAFANGVVTITNKYAFVDGYMIYIDSATVNVANGQTVYLNVFEKQTVGPTDSLKKYGNENGTSITNYIMDSRYGQEISKRIVLAYSLATSQVSGAKVITIGTVSSGGVMSWSYPTSKQASGRGYEDSKDYLYANAKEIPFTWAELAAKRDAGDFSGLEIGDYKSIALEGELAGTTIVMEIAGMDVYYGWATNNKHSIDFVTRDVVMKKRMHSSNNTVGGFEAMELYTYLETTVYNCLPAEVRAVIQPKKVYLENKAAQVSTTWAAKELNLWLLADIELFGYSSFSQKNFGLGNFKRYPLYQSERHLIKKFNGSAWWYWLIQPDERNTTYWCYCYYYGYSYGYNASYEDGGLVFGFRI